MVAAEDRFMTRRFASLMTFPVFLLLGSTPAYVHAQQPEQGQQHEEHHPATAPDVAAPSQPPGASPQRSNTVPATHGTDQQVEELVKKMNAATGPQKIDAIAELLTLLVQRQHAMHAMHESMMPHMCTMEEMHHSGGGKTHK
jgi:hypothetical protein